MNFKRLSAQVQELSNPQRSDAFVRLFREAVREGRLDAAELPERFTLPKHFRSRGSATTYQREAKEMLFEVTPAFTAWFTKTDAALRAPERRTRVKPTKEAIERGEVDFGTLAAQTRAKLQAAFLKGQQLGRSRRDSRKRAFGKVVTGARRRR